MKKKIIFFLLFLQGLSGYSQDELTNLQKYWHYRFKLVNYYMVVGDGPGMSLPADIRNTNTSVEIRWGESPVYLGYYMGVLATEYKLLHDNGQNTDQTLTELYYAIKAVIRIDNVAESYPVWDQVYSNTTDGFLIRDDVPANFVSTHLSQLNINLPINQGVTPGSGTPAYVSSMTSDFSSISSSDHPKAIAVSQDVLYQLLMGFALVSKYIDPGVLSFNNYVTGNSMQADLRSMALVKQI
jgi:hypothetical protein